MHIVLVDDTPDHLELLSEFVQDLRPGATIRCLQDGQELPRLLEENPVDLVMVDLMMPTINGFDLVHQLRQVHRWQSLPIIAVSGLQRSNHQQAIQQAGFTDYIVKPYDFSELVRVLDQHLPA